MGTATRRIILVGTVALFSLLFAPRLAAQIPNPNDVQDTADNATQGAQDAVDDVQDTADNATQGAQGTVGDAQDTVDGAGGTATGAQQDVQDAVDDTGETAADKASGAIPGSSKKNARSAAKQLFGGGKSSTAASDREDAPADLADLVAAG
ncbi:MAG: hypothetical protein M3214_10130, partial [Actinomycetota bacterium]|nr:hypothetical protein [Actinomycetota bacterium]